MIKFINFKTLMSKDDNLNLFLLHCECLLKLIKSKKKFTNEEILFINNTINNIFNNYNNIDKNVKLKVSCIKSTNDELKLYYYVDLKFVDDMSFNFIECLINLDNKLQYLIARNDNNE